jgi:hypothetical protein
VLLFFAILAGANSSSVMLIALNSLNQLPGYSPYRKDDTGLWLVCFESLPGIMIVVSLRIPFLAGFACNDIEKGLMINSKRKYESNPPGAASRKGVNFC